MTDVREPDIMRNVDKWYIYTTEKAETSIIGETMERET